MTYYVLVCPTRFSAKKPTAVALPVSALVVAGPKQQKCEPWGPALRTLVIQARVETVRFAKNSYSLPSHGLSLTPKADS